MKNKIIAFFKQIYASFKQSLLIKITTFLFVVCLVMNIITSTSAEKKVAANLQQNKLSEEITKFRGLSEDFRKITIIKFGSYDKYYFELKDGKPTLDKQYTEKESKQVQASLIQEMKIPHEILEASYYDLLNFYVLTPIADSIASILSNILAVVMLVMFTLSIFIMKMNMGKNKSKYKIELPENIKSSIDDLIGMEDVKAELNNIVEMYKNRHAFKEYGILESDQNFNLMFSGPAGTGKTQLAGILAKEFNCPIIIGSAAGLETGLVGGGANAIKSIYDEASKFPRCIIFLDEAEVLFKKRNSGGVHSHKNTDDTANMALSLIEGIGTKNETEIIWVVASNFNEVTNNMDEAMLRRFPIKLDFRLPNKSERKDMFKLYMKNVNEAKTLNVDYDYMAEVSAGLSPANIKTIVQRAGIDAANKNVMITTDVLYNAYEKATIGLTNRETTAHALEKRKLVGIHELGHFVVQLDELIKNHSFDFKAIKENMKVLKISTESVAKQGALGYVISKQEEVGLSTLHDLENQVKQLYGGVVAEKEFFGDRMITVGSGNDIEKATSILKAMIFSLGMYSKSKINYQVLNNNAKNDELVKFMEAKSEEMFQQTEVIVKQYKPFIEYLAPILLEKYVLQSEEIMDHIEKFYSPKAVEFEAHATEVGHA